MCSGSRSTSAARNLVLILAGMAQVGDGSFVDGSDVEALSWLSIYALVVTFLAVILGGFLLMKRGYDGGDEEERPTTRRRRETPEGEGDLETETYNTSEVAETDAEVQNTSDSVQTGDEGRLRGEVPGGDLRRDIECPGDPLHPAVPHGEQSSGGELREGG